MENRRRRVGLEAIVFYCFWLFVLFLSFLPSAMLRASRRLLPPQVVLRAGLESAPGPRSIVFTPKRFFSENLAASTAGSATKPLHLPFHRQVWEDVKKYIRRYAMVRVGLIAGAGATAYFYLREDVVGRMLTQFGRDDINYTRQLQFKVDRPAIVKQLQEVFLLPDPANYYVFVGETGTGKSTAVQEAVSTLKDPEGKLLKPRGVVYFMAPEDPVSFSARLAKAVAYDLDLVGGFRRQWSGRTAQDSDPSSWPALSGAIEAAQRFKEEQGRPLVLVIDAADFIAKRDPVFMKTLEDFAKTNADRGNLRVVFVTNEDSTLPLMMGSSSIRRGR